MGRLSQNPLLVCIAYSNYDLARLYHVETIELKRQIRRNIERFEGDDYMFEISHEELLRCHFGTSSWRGSRKQLGVYPLQTHRLHSSRRGGLTPSQCPHLPAHLRRADHILSALSYTPPQAAGLQLRFAVYDLRFATRGWPATRFYQAFVPAGT